MKIAVVVIVVVQVVLGITASSAGAVEPGFDLFETDPAGTTFSFREEFTIPPSFFEQGSACVRGRCGVRRRAARHVPGPGRRQRRHGPATRSTRQLACRTGRDDARQRAAGPGEGWRGHAVVGRHGGAVDGEAIGRPDRHRAGRGRRHVRDLAHRLPEVHVHTAVRRHGAHIRHGRHADGRERAQAVAARAEHPVARGLRAAGAGRPRVRQWLLPRADGPAHVGGWAGARRHAVPSHAVPRPAAARALPLLPHRVRPAAGRGAATGRPVRIAYGSSCARAVRCAHRRRRTASRSSTAARTSSATRSRPSGWRGTCRSATSSTRST